MSSLRENPAPDQPDARTAAVPPAGPDPRRVGDRRSAAWIRLQEGNLRWAGGRSTAEGSRSPQRRADLVEGQSPFAMVLSCADSRVPTELLFDQGIGDLFVVRTAGHAVDDTVLGSLEYGVGVLGVDLVLVLGHEGCGAVAATARSLSDGTVPDGHVRSIVEALTANVTRAREAGVVGGDQLAQWHAVATAEQLQQRSALLQEAVFHSRVGVVAATYELASGLVVPARRTRPADAAGRPDLVAHLVTSRRHR